MRAPRSLDATAWAILFGALVRLAIFPFAEDLYSDAPIRSDIAQAWARHPGLWWSYREVAQYGPFPAHLEGALIRLGIPGMLGARLVPLAFGIAGLFLVARLGRRLSGDPGAAFAAWALALSPLHLQASTTCASEAIFLVLCLGVIEGALDARPLLLALSAFAATTTRYDAWLWLPPLAIWLLWRGRNLKSLLMAGALALGPASILLANGLELGRPLRPLEHISNEHVGLVAQLGAKYGLLWHLMGALFWPAAALVALTPGFALLTLRALRRVRGSAVVPAIVAFVPPAIYAARDLLTGAFLPLLRMAGVPSELAATFVRGVGRRALLACVALGLAFDVGTFALAEFPNPLQDRALRATPVSRLPEPLRAGEGAVREARGTVAIDQSGNFEDIVIAHHAGRDRFQLYAPLQPPDRIVAIAGARLDAELRATGRAFGRSCTLAGEDAPISWWDCR